MRKSGWAAAGLGLLVLLLTACGSSSSPTSAPQSSAAASTHAAQPQPSSNIGGTIAAGTTIMIAQKSKLGYVLALASGQVVYTYAHDPAGGTPTCTGSCASIWLPVTGTPQAVAGDHFPGTFGLVTRSDGTKQITYNGHPLYTFKGATAMSTAGNGIEGAWYVVMLSAADIG
jgi:predicted lipoprotein with Yx(FWY)xxD motif